MPIRTRFDDAENRWSEIKPMALIFTAPLGKMTRTMNADGSFSFEIQADEVMLTLACDCEIDAGVNPIEVKIPRFTLKLPGAKKVR